MTMHLPGILLSATCGLLLACGATPATTPATTPPTPAPAPAAPTTTETPPPATTPAGPATYSTMHCKTRRTFNYETADITGGAKVTVELRAGTDVFHGGKVSWPAIGTRTRHISMTFAAKSCVIPGNMIDRVQCKAESIEGVSFRAGDRGKLAPFTAKTIEFTSTRKGKDEYELSFSAVGMKGELAQVAMKMEPGACSRK